MVLLGFFEKQLISLQWLAIDLIGTYLAEFKMHFYFDLHSYIAFELEKDRLVFQWITFACMLWPHFFGPTLKCIQSYSIRSTF